MTVPTSFPYLPVQRGGAPSPFPPVLMLFAWAASDDVPTLFGYANFFLEFNVCFFATRGEFTVAPRTP